MCTETQEKPTRMICLKPSSTNYKTFIETTRKAMGKDAVKSSKTKPNMRVLSLVRTGS